MHLTAHRVREQVQDSTQSWIVRRRLDAKQDFFVAQYEAGG